LACLLVCTISAFGQLRLLENQNLQNDGARYLIIDVPGATEGTTPTGINSAGEITGYFVDELGWHDFVFTPDGRPIQKFDPPGSVQTFTGGINSQGTVVGYYKDAQFLAHGFLRTRQGVITKFDLPSGWQPASFGSAGPAINDSGQVVGSLSGPDGIDGYVLPLGGQFTLFRALGKDTFANGLSASGAIAGYYYTVKQPITFSFHGYVRDANGAITPFDFPSSAQTLVLSNSINSAGAVTGYYQTADSVSHGFVRDHNGAFTSFDVPGAKGTGPWDMAINDAGRITGTYVDSNSVSHGFVRDAGGSITTFDPPGSVTTYPVAINSAGVVVGVFIDSNGIYHGFVRIPPAIR
jgi:hypothetical protein